MRFVLKCPIFFLDNLELFKDRVRSLQNSYLAKTNYGPKMGVHGPLFHVLSPPISVGDISV